MIDPTLKEPKYVNTYKEIIYLAHEYNDLSNSEEYPIVKFDENIINNRFIRYKTDKELTLNSQFYAYGIMLDMRCSNIIPLDFDNYRRSNISYINIKEIIYDYIKKLDLVTDKFTIIASNEKYHYHVLIYLNNYIDIRNIFKKISRDYVCSGFLDTSLKKSFSILRVSQKFYSDFEIDFPVMLNDLTYKKFAQYLPF